MNKNRMLSNFYIPSNIPESLEKMKNLWKKENHENANIKKIEKNENIEKMWKFWKKNNEKFKMKMVFFFLVEKSFESFESKI